MEPPRASTMKLTRNLQGGPVPHTHTQTHTHRHTHTHTDTRTRTTSGVSVDTRRTPPAGRGGEGGEQEEKKVKDGSYTMRIHGEEVMVRSML